MKTEQPPNIPEVAATREIIEEAFESLLMGKEDPAAEKAIADLCKRVRVPYPKTGEEIEGLIERLNNSEFDEEIEKVLRE